MADNEQTEGEVAAPKSKKKLFIIVGAVVGLLLVGGGTWFFFLRSHEDEHAAHAEPVAKPLSYIDVPEITVNLAGSPGEKVQYLKAKIVLEIKDEKQVEVIKPAMPRVTDLFQTYLRELRSNDLNGSIGMFRLKEELTKRVNVALAPSQVNAVLFKEILVQ